MRHAGDLRVLLGDALARVYHDEAHVRALDGQLRAHDGEFLDAVVHLRAAADARRVDEDVFAVFVFKLRVHGVARGSGLVGNYDALFAEDEVDERALAHVGLADDGHVDALVVLLALLRGREMRHAGVQKVACAVPVHGGELDRVAEAERIELVEPRVRQPGRIHLVHAQHHRLFGAQQHISHLAVRGGDAGADLRHQDDHVRRVDGDLRLLAHEEQYLAVGRGLYAAGIHYIKFPPVPLALGVEPVARDARRVLHDGEALARQAVEEQGLAHVGPPHYGYKGSGHSAGHLSRSDSV